MCLINWWFKTKILFGLNSGVITTAGLITGLIQTEISYKILIISILSLAISDSFSESYGFIYPKKRKILVIFTKGPLLSLVFYLQVSLL